MVGVEISVSLMLPFQILTQCHVSKSIGELHWVVGLVLHLKDFRWKRHSTVDVLLGKEKYQICLKPCYLFAV